MKRLLIMEDGDEYLRFFARHVDGYDYAQARSYAACLEHLQNGNFDGFVVDLRFDRVPRTELIGDPEDIAEDLFGDVSEIESAWRYIEDNQGFLILQALRAQNHHQPALLITDIPARRRANLERLYGRLLVVPSFDAKEIRDALGKLVGG